jgi:5'(3')-deoxyribonucleotidase
MKKTLVTDCDGVLLQWLTHVPDFVADLGLDTSHLKDCFKGNKFIPFSDLFMATDEAEAFSRLEAYHESDYLKKLPIMELGADRVVENLSKEYEIIVVTSFSESVIAQKNREENLMLRYGNAISDLICLPQLADKTEVLKDLAKSRDVKIWLDDQIKHVHHGINAGIESYQYTHGMDCGRNTGEVKELNSWKKVEALLLKEDNALKRDRVRRRP